MNDAPGDAELAQNQFATAVRNFTRKLPAKFQKLLPFKDGIAELRRKRASYEAIADILRNIDVAVSHDTVARFCREVLELTPRTRRPRKASAKALQHDSTGNPKANLVRKANTPQSDKGDRPDLRVFRPPSLGGPRIADPKTI
jgi:hypothetical protein